MTARGYTLIEPAGDAPREGVVLLLDARPFDAESFEFTPGTLDAEATARGLAVLHVTTGNPLDFLLEDTAVREVAERVLAILKDVARRVRIDHRRVYVTGASNGGFLTHRLACLEPAIFAAAPHPGLGLAPLAPGLEHRLLGVEVVVAEVGEASTTSLPSSSLIAAAMVSRSRISPSSTTSGSWRSTRRMASGKVGTSLPSSRCVTSPFL